jgi:hypothetical protein
MWKCDIKYDNNDAFPIRYVALGPTYYSIEGLSEIIDDV